MKTITVYYRATTYYEDSIEVPDDFEYKELESDDELLNLLPFDNDVGNDVIVDCIDSSAN